jgi:hypothetical protein
MSWISITLKNTFYIVLLTLLLIVLVEATMFGLHSITGSKYFSSSSENQFNSNDCPIPISNQIERPIKMAIFGGSSSNGYASPISFSKLLCDSNFTNQSLAITNYAKNGAPFSNFQSEIIKAVMKDYDVIVIYSGHNEVWTQVNTRDSKTFFPNGMTTPEPESVHIKRIRELKALTASSYSISPWIVNYSRIYHFADKFTNKLKSVFAINKESKEKLVDEVYPRQFYYRDNFLTSIEEKNIVNFYKKNLIEISNKLRSDQKLVISTVMSNDLFPPIADVYQAKHNEEIDVLNKKLREAYSFLLNNEFDKLQKIVNTLPKTAHRYYLEGMLCLKTNTNSINHLPKKCLSKLIKSREFDKLQLRVIPEINSFIRQFSHQNVIIVDPVQDFISKVDSIEEYKEYFVDFQHPSQLGHALIAENILLSLFPYRSISRIYGKDLCGVSWKSNGKLMHIKSPYRQCVNSYKANIKWLENFSNIQPVSYQYDNYKSKSKINLSTVEGESS